MSETLLGVLPFDKGFAGIRAAGRWLNEGTRIDVGGRRSFTFAVAAYNLTRLPKLMGAGRLV
jgi:hypothetical protein